MGKVRTETVKRTARDLLEKYPNRFDSDFNLNKNQVMEILDVDAKKLRNRIAGYITRLKRIEQQKIKAPESSEEEGESPSEKHSP